MRIPANSIYEVLSPLRERWEYWKQQQLRRLQGQPPGRLAWFLDCVGFLIAALLLALVGTVVLFPGTTPAQGLLIAVSSGLTLFALWYRWQSSRIKHQKYWWEAVNAVDSLRRLPVGEVAAELSRLLVGGRELLPYNWPGRPSRRQPEYLLFRSADESGVAIIFFPLDAGQELVQEKILPVWRKAVRLGIKEIMLCTSGTIKIDETQFVSGVQLKCFGRLELAALYYRYYREHGLSKKASGDKSLRLTLPSWREISRILLRPTAVKTYLGAAFLLMACSLLVETSWIKVLYIAALLLNFSLAAGCLLLRSSLLK